jgi:radial spoke head protein 9
MKLEISLLKLNEAQSFEHIVFWGKIEGSLPLVLFEFLGSDNDYYIALGLNFKGVYEFPIKKFFWRYLSDNSS